MMMPHSLVQVGDVLAVTLMRPLAASDEWDRAWPLDGSAFSVWALGPVSEGSTSDQPVVLYHRLQLPGAAAEDSVNAPTGANFTVRLGTPSPQGACSPLLAQAVTAAERGSPAQGPAEAPRTPVATLSGVTVFNVTEGSEWRHAAEPATSLQNPVQPLCFAAAAATVTATPVDPPPPWSPTDNFNYPNPPGWGVSYHINGEESPVLAVVRGTTYTFNGGRLPVCRPMRGQCPGSPCIPSCRCWPGGQCGQSCAPSPLLCVMGSRRSQSAHSTVPPPNYLSAVMAGPNHPFYLTDSIVGGGSYSSFQSETVYGGGDEVAGERGGGEASPCRLGQAPAQRAHELPFPAAAASGPRPPLPRCARLLQRIARSLCARVALCATG